MEAIRIIKEMRDESTKQLRLRGADVNIRFIQPRYMVWENVPGAFSSNKGEDFRAVLEETAKIVCEDAVIPRPENGKWSPSGVIMGNGWSIAWRVHDAQFWGVPQLRKRIALVADFGGGTAPKILFESKGLSGDFEASREKGQGASSAFERNADPSSYTLKIRGGVEVDSHGKKAGKGPLIQTELSGTLGVSQDQTLITKVISVDEKMGQTYIGEEVGNTLGARDYKQPQAVAYTTQACGDRDDPSQSYQENLAYTVPSNPMSDRGQAVVYGISAYNSEGMKSNNPNTGIYEAETTRTLDLNGGSPACNQGGMAIVQTNGVCYGLDRASFNQGQNAQYDFCVTEEQAQTLVAKGPGGVLATNQAIGEYKITGVASSLKQRDYKDATDLVIQNENYPKQQGGSVSNGR
jgi:DNA (cytosine-5)-methyltransferase 1